MLAKEEIRKSLKCTDVRVVSLLVSLTLVWSLQSWSPDPAQQPQGLGPQTSPSLQSSLPLSALLQPLLQPLRLVLVEPWCAWKPGFTTVSTVLDLT